jgi:hypothetical protein
VQSRWPVEIHPIGRAAAATVAWRHRGRFWVSVVVKATFSFVTDGLMPAVAPDEIHATDIHYGGSLAQSIWAASDLAPFRARADVVLTGHAPVPEESATVRLAVYRDRALIDKSFDVFTSGDFEGKDRVPLRYEHAPGGPEQPDNPVGTSLPSLVDTSDPQRPVGFGPIAAAWPARARLLGALDPRALTAPIALLPDDLDWSYFVTAPADQVMEYLQGDEWIVLENLLVAHPLVRMKLPSAHAEARVLGLSPEPGPAVKMVADQLHIDVDRARCSVTWRGSFEVGSEAALQRASVLAGVAVAGQPIVWPTFPAPTSQRAPIAVPPPPPSRAASSAPTSQRAPIAVPPPPPSYAAITAPTSQRAPIAAPPPISQRAPIEAPITAPLPPSVRLPPIAAPPLPPLPPTRPMAMAMPSIDRAPSSPFEMTMEIEDEPTSQPILPFSRSSAGLRAPSPSSPTAAAAESRFESTMAVSADEADRAVALARALPFAAPSAPLPQAARSFEQTSIIEDDDDGPDETTVPRAPAFLRARPGAASRPSLGIPGAPWSDIPAAPVPRPSAELDEQTKTFSIRQLVPSSLQTQSEPAPVPAPEPAPAPAVESTRTPPVVVTVAAADPPPVVVPEAPKGDPKQAWSWAGVAEPKVEMTPPPPPRKPPTPAVQNALYGRFNAKKK